MLSGASAFDFASRTGRLGAELESLGDGGARWNRLFCREQVELESLCDPVGVVLWVVLHVALRQVELWIVVGLGDCTRCWR